MLKLLLLPILILTGCANVTSRPVDNQCSQLATYTRSIAVLKQAGITVNDINSFTAQPVVLTFPFQKLKTDVYAREFDTPADMYVYFYNMCVTTGYNNMLDQLRVDERGWGDGMLRMSTELTPVVERSAK